MALDLFSFIFNPLFQRFLLLFGWVLVGFFFYYFLIFWTPVVCAAAALVMNYLHFIIPTMIFKQKESAHGNTNPSIIEIIKLFYLQDENL